MPSPSQLLQNIASLSITAGDAIMQIYNDGFEVDTKEDNSPVTAADHAAHAIIAEGLTTLTPEIHQISEEGDAALYQEGLRRFWLVDPLDGTKSFIRRKGEFTVNIALIEDGKPVLGVVYLPASGELYAGEASHGCWKTSNQNTPWQPIAVRTADRQKLDVVMSESHLDPETEAYVKRLPVGQAIKAGSSVKFCVIAEGKADLYPRFGRTMEWDTAAGQAVLEAAGGAVLTTTGEYFIYGKTGFANGHFIAASSEALAKIA